MHMFVQIVQPIRCVCCYAFVGRYTYIHICSRAKTAGKYWPMMRKTGDCTGAANDDSSDRKVTFLYKSNFLNFYYRQSRLRYEEEGYGIYYFIFALGKAVLLSGLSNGMYRIWKLHGRLFGWTCRWQRYFL